MCNCFAILGDTDDERAEIWKQVAPNLTIPLKFPIPVRAKAPDGTVMEFLEGDPDRLDEFQRIRLAELMSENFNIDIHVISNQLKKGIMPIKNENVYVSICEKHLRCML